jgi:hypothetical protein
MEVPADLQYALLSKVVSYDRNFPTRATQPKVTIGIVYQEKNLQSVNAKDAFVKEITSGPIRQIASKPVTYRTFAVDKGISSLQSLTPGEVQVMIITPLKAADIGGISLVCRDADILSFASISSYCDKGIAVGVELVGEKTQLVVNLPAARMAGCDLSSQLLKVSRVIN